MLNLRSPLDGFRSPLGRALAAVGPPPDPHRYWMIAISANNGNLLCGLAELELYETADGPNVAVGVTASANSYLTDGYQASYAFDGIQSGSNGWASYVAGAPWWIKADFGAGNEKDINAIGMWAKNVGLDEMPKNFDIRWSDNDSDYTTKWSVANATSWAEYERRRFIKP